MIRYVRDSGQVSPPITTIKQGSTYPLIQIEFLDASTQRHVDLTAFTISVEYKKFDLDTSEITILTPAGTVAEGAEDGILSYQFGAADTASIGVYFLWFKLIDESDFCEYVPAINGLQINIF